MLLNQIANSMRTEGGDLTTGNEMVLAQSIPVDPLDLDSTHRGMTQQEGVAYEKLRAFCANIMKKLAPPLLREVQASSLRPDAEPFTPKRTTRASKHSVGTSAVKPKPTENVLLRTLGLVPDDMVADEDAVSELQQLSDLPLREQHVRIIAALFGKTVPSADALTHSTDVTVSVR